MEFIFLGTSSGAPTKTRNISGLAIKKASAKTWHLVDCGEGTQHQILHTNLSLNQLDTIFITHVHGDHCFGLPGLISSATMSGRTKPLTIVAPNPVKEFVNVALSVSQTRLSYDINYIDVTAHLNMKNIEVSGFDIEIGELSHRVPSFSYHFIESNIPAQLDTNKLNQENIEAGPIWGKIQSEKEFTLPDGTIRQSSDYLLTPRKPRKVIVAGDNDTPSLLSEYAEQANILIHEATFTADISEKIGNRPQHSTAEKVAQFAENSRIPHLLLSHFSSRYQDSGNEKGSICEIENEAKANYSGNLFLAKDFDRFHLDIEGNLNKSSVQAT